MSNTPLKLEGTGDNIYAGFGPRLVSLLLDFLFFLPIGLATLYINSLGKNYYFYTVIPNLLFGFYYHVYLPRYTGGTPGKNIMGIKIIKLDGGNIGWKEAILRHIVLFIITLFGILAMSDSILAADDTTFNTLSWLQQSAYLMSLSPVLFTIFNWVNNIWIWSELLVLLTNRRKRAIHDFIAGTVIVKARYADQINHEMRDGEAIDDTLPASGTA